MVGFLYLSLHHGREFPRISRIFLRAKKRQTLKWYLIGIESNDSFTIRTTFVGYTAPNFGKPPNGMGASKIVGLFHGKSDLSMDDLGVPLF
jgi:hypothetical protein